MTGDGELQEGQNYEALHAAVHQDINGLTVIVDNNTLQSDMAVADIMNLGDLEAQFRAFGWHVARCDGHDFHALENVFNEFSKVTHEAENPDRRHDQRARCFVHGTSGGARKRRRLLQVAFRRA